MTTGRKLRNKVKKSEERGGCYTIDNTYQFSIKYPMVLGQEAPENWKRKKVFSCSMKHTKQIKG